MIKVYQQGGSKLALEFYSSLSLEDRARFDKELQECIMEIKETWEHMVDIISTGSRHIVTWWNTIPPEIREGFMEKAKEGDESQL